jgi:hypothetical protein
MIDSANKTILPPCLPAEWIPSDDHPDGILSVSGWDDYVIIRLSSDYIRMGVASVV